MLCYFGMPFSCKLQNAILNADCIKFRLVVEPGGRGESIFSAINMPEKLCFKSRIENHFLIAFASLSLFSPPRTIFP